MIEFTGERVVPGQVDPDLWNEHFSRYLFAARLARGKRVADLGCGAGYGSAELARTAAAVTGFDVSGEAIAHARENYSSPNLSFVEAPCEAIPEPDESFDLVVAFEVIEHLADQQKLLQEARRLLKPGGQFVVSTPNREYYASSRAASGPNPFHTREFSLPEFKQLLVGTFPHVTLFTQNHADTLIVRPVEDAAGQPVVRVENNGSPESAHFFIAVCALAPQLGSPTFVYLPSAANVLRERELHIAALERELATKQQWLDKSVAEHAELVARFRDQKGELEKVNGWVEKQDAELADKIAHVGILQRELRESTELADILRTRLAAEDSELETKVAELGAAVAQLHATEAELESRTNWALTLDREKRELLERLGQSRWIRIGRKLNLGPDISS